MTDSTDALIERCPLGGIELKLRIETFASETNEQINRKTKHKQRNGVSPVGLIMALNLEMSICTRVHAQLLIMPRHTRRH